MFVVLLLLYQLPDDPSDDSRAQLWGDENERHPVKPPVSSESEPMEEDVPETPAPTPAPESAPTVSVRSVRSVRSRSTPVVVTSRTVIREQQTVPYDAYVWVTLQSATFCVGRTLSFVDWWISWQWDPEVYPQRPRLQISAPVFEPLPIYSSPAFGCDGSQHRWSWSREFSWRCSRDGQSDGVVGRGDASSGETRVDAGRWC